MSRDLVVVDVETNGLDPDRHEVVEAAWWNLTTDERGSFVPVHQSSKILAAADIAALRVNRYVDRLADADQDRDFTAIRRMASHVNGATLVGANPAFDAVMLRKLFERNEDELGDGWPVWHHRLWDVEAYAAGVLGLSELLGLSALCAALSIEPRDHTAAADVEATGRCFLKLREIAQAQATMAERVVSAPVVAL